MAYITNIESAREEEMKEWNRATAEDDNSGENGELPQDDVPIENIIPSAPAPDVAPDSVDYVTEDIDTGMNPDLTV